MLQDLLHSLRALRKRAGFAALAVLTIALGIGVNTAIFTVVNSVLWKPYPYAESERLVRFREDSPSGSLSIALVFLCVTLRLCGSARNPPSLAEPQSRKVTQRTP
jgi:hypothetical protein